MAGESSKMAGPDPGIGPAALAAAFPGRELSLASLSVHADDYINNHRAVAPPMHVSTTFRYARDPEELTHWDNVDPNAPFDSHMYSRATAPNTTRLEAVLTSLLGGPALTYSSGLAAFHALLVVLNPKRIAIGGGYHGCHGVIGLVSRLSGLEKLTLAETDLEKLEEGDVLHVETPLNPTGEARDLAAYSAVARRRGAYLTVDATFAPPPLQDPFALGADFVMHSGTKYFGGHSDMLCGVLAVRPGMAAAQEEGEGGGGGGWLRRLRADRIFLGSVMGSLEGWLGVRSLRTLELRVERQSRSAERLVAWLASEVAPAPATADGGSSGSGSSSPAAAVVARIVHASLQPEARVEGSWLRQQMPRGYGPVFSVWLGSEAHARRLPSKLHLFHHATSLGGVESLIEWRAMTDPGVDRTLLRVSVGIEGWEDLKADLEQGFRALLDEDAAEKA